MRMGDIFPLIVICTKRNKMDSPAIINSITPVNSLSVFTQAKITPFRVIDLFQSGETIYEFIKITDKEAKYLSRTTKRDMALITVSRDKQRFKVSFYSEKDGTQIVQDLEISKLREAVNELKAAGFN